MQTDRIWGCRGGVAFVLACVVGGCAGGQTGEQGNQSGSNDDGDGGVVLPRARCELTGDTIGLDDPMPAGYSARELLDRVADTTVPAYAWRSPDRLYTLTYDSDIAQLTPEHAEATLELRVRVRYEGDDEVELYDPACTWGDAIALPVTLMVEASDGSVERDVPGILYSTPDGAVFYADDDRVPQESDDRDRYRKCDEGPVDVSFIRELPRGELCDARGRIVIFPAACGGFAETPVDEDATAELPSPREVLTEIGERTRYDVTWPDGQRSTLELTLTPSEYVCHRDEISPFQGEVSVHGWWETHLDVRFSWLEQGYDYTLPGTLSANDSRYEHEVLFFSNEPVFDETLAFFAEQLGTRLTWGSSHISISRQSGGELVRSFHLFDQDEGEAQLLLEPK